MENNALFARFFDDAVITDVMGIVKTGKEAVVYKCRAHESTDLRFIAVKAYKEIGRRSFRDMGAYLDGRPGRSIRGRRDILHMMSTPSSMQAQWIEAEYRALETLHGRGIRVPRPFAKTADAVAMEFIGDDPCAPRLLDTEMDRVTASEIFGIVSEDIRIMLRNDMIHGDLSPYNILVDDGEPVIIDFPQVVDARYHSQAKEMLARDVRNTFAHFRRWRGNAESEAGDFSDALWDAYESNRL